MLSRWRTAAFRQIAHKNPEKWNWLTKGFESRDYTFDHFDQGCPCFLLSFFEWREIRDTKVLLDALVRNAKQREVSHICSSWLANFQLTIAWPDKIGSFSWLEERQMGGSLRFVLWKDWLGFECTRSLTVNISFTSNFLFINTIAGVSAGFSLLLGMLISWLCDYSDGRKSWITTMWSISRITNHYEDFESWFDEWMHFSLVSGIDRFRDCEGWHLHLGVIMLVIICFFRIFYSCRIFESVKRAVKVF